MERGVYVPDDVTIKMVMEWVEAPDHADGFVLDGFPRTVAQASALDKELADKGGIDKVLYIKVSDDELMRRLTGRLICRNCQTPYHVHFSPPNEADKCDKCGGVLYERADDKAEVVSKRIRIYHEETSPVIEHYRKSGKLFEIDGEGSIKEITKALTKVVSLTKPN